MKTDNCSSVTGFGLFQVLGALVAVVRIERSGAGWIALNHGLGRCPVPTALVDELVSKEWAEVADKALVLTDVGRNALLKYYRAVAESAADDEGWIGADADIKGGPPSKSEGHT